MALRVSVKSFPHLSLSLEFDRLFASLILGLLVMLLRRLSTGYQHQLLV